MLAQIPWYHNLALLTKLDKPRERLWYARKAFENGWSRNVLVHHIETRLCERQGAASTNFGSTLPAPESDLARATLKDPYTFDFLALAEDARERDLERGLLENLERFMLELGRFKPDYAGQLGFYLAAIDNHLRRPDDARSIGLLLCREKNNVVVEYTLQDSTRPMGVAEYKILPPDLRKELPSVEELQARVVDVAGSLRGRPTD